MTETQLSELRRLGEEMVGQIPGTHCSDIERRSTKLIDHSSLGLKSFQMGAVLASTAHRAQGFDMGLMTVMETEEDVLAYAPHPAHQKVHKLRETLCHDTIVYDMVL